MNAGETPLTDAVLEDGFERGNFIRHTRQLERDLAAARKERDEARDQLFHEREALAAMGRSLEGARANIAVTEAERDTAMKLHAQVAWDNADIKARMDKAVRWLTPMLHRHDTPNEPPCPCARCVELRAIVEGKI